MMTSSKPKTSGARDTVGDAVLGVAFCTINPLWSQNFKNLKSRIKPHTPAQARQHLTDRRVGLSQTSTLASWPMCLRDAEDVAQAGFNSR